METLQQLLKFGRSHAQLGGHLLQMGEQGVGDLIRIIESCYKGNHYGFVFQETHLNIVLERAKLMLHLHALVVRTIVEQRQLGICSGNGHREVQSGAHASLCVSRQQRPEVVHQITAHCHINSRAVRTLHIDQRQLVRLHSATACRPFGPFDKVRTAGADRVAILALAVRLLGLREPAGVRITLITHHGHGSRHMVAGINDHQTLATGHDQFHCDQSVLLFETVQRIGHAVLLAMVDVRLGGFDSFLARYDVEVLGQLRILQTNASHDLHGKTDAHVVATVDRRHVALVELAQIGGLGLAERRVEVDKVVGRIVVGVLEQALQRYFNLGRKVFVLPNLK